MWRSRKKGVVAFLSFIPCRELGLGAQSYQVEPASSAKKAPKLPPSHSPGTAAPGSLRTGCQSAVVKEHEGGPGLTERHSSAATNVSRHEEDES